MSLLRFKKVMILDNQRTQTNFKIPNVWRRNDYSFEMNMPPMSSKGTVARKSIMNQLLQYSIAI